MKKTKIKKEYKYKKTSQLVKKLRHYWLQALEATSNYYDTLVKIEELASKKTKIKNLEFFFSDNYLAGIGNADTTMELIQDSDFKKVADEN